MVGGKVAEHSVVTQKGNTVCLFVFILFSAVNSLESFQIRQVGVALPAETCGVTIPYFQKECIGEDSI